MASRTGVQFYRLRLKEAHSRQWLEFGRSRDHNLLSDIRAYLHWRLNTCFDLADHAADPNNIPPTLQRTLEVTRVSRAFARAEVCAAVKTGEYGNPGEIVDAKSGAVRPHKSLGDADIAPFFVLFHVPDQAKVALVAMETQGIRGIKTALGVDLKKWFQGRGFTLHLDVLTDREALIQYLTGPGVRLRDLEVRSAKVNNDARQVMRDSRIAGHKLEQDAVLSVRVAHAPATLMVLKNRLITALRAGRDPRQLVSIGGLDSYQDLIIDVATADKQVRKFEISRPGSAGFRELIEGKITRGPDGHPTFRSMRTVLRGMTDEIKQQVHL
ncbi:MAG: hypothetical protein WD468_12985 [Pirellulales bacterium]